MDIVSRLKKFLELSAIPITQFADAATIPRPTLSQILNGRNKKISNEILDKIHKGYPSLSMMWLMFGDGEMMVDGASVPHYKPAEQANTVDESGRNLFADMPIEDETPSDTTSQNPDMATTPQETSFQGPDATKVAASAAFALSADSSKKIQNIMVFYSDNSFEIFVPANR